MSLKATVAHGARWMDQNHPGWHDKINTAKLAMEFTRPQSNRLGKSCIGAQLSREGNYWDFMAENNLFGGRAARLGLNLNLCQSRNWQYPTRLWKNEIRERRRQ